MRGKQSPEIWGKIESRDMRGKQSSEIWGKIESRDIKKQILEIWGENRVQIYYGNTETESSDMMGTQCP